MLENDRTALTPGAHLRAEIDRLGLDQVEVAEAARVSRQTINNIVNGRQAISRAMAAKLGRLTRRSSDYWLRSSFPSTEAAAGAPGYSGDTPPAADEASRERPLGVLVNHQIIRAVKDGVVGIEPFSERHVQPASIDLTLDDFIITADGEEIDISDGQIFALRSGCAVNVRTKEWVEFPLDYVGRVGAMTKLAKFGIMTSHGFQIDPGYKGNLQFCLFNAGGKSFSLRSGIAIISLEIMPLAATPSRDDRATDHLRMSSDRSEVISHFRNDVCDRLIRSAVRNRVNIDSAPEGISAKIPELEIELIEATTEGALDSAVSEALGTLASLHSNPAAPVELRDKYDSFFENLVERLYLSAEQARRALSCLGLPAEGNSNQVAKLRDGGTAMLHLPVNSAKIPFKHLARQLREKPLDLLLLLAGLLRYAKPSD